MSGERMLHFEQLESRLLLAHLSLVQGTTIDANICASDCAVAGFEIPQEWDRNDPPPYRDEAEINPVVRKYAEVELAAYGQLDAPDQFRVDREVTNLFWGEPFGATSTFNETIRYRIEPGTNERIGDPVFVYMDTSVGGSLCRGTTNTTASIQVAVDGRSSASASARVALAHDDSDPKYFAHQCKKLPRVSRSDFGWNWVIAEIGDTVTVNLQSTFQASLLSNLNELYPSKSRSYVDFDFDLSPYPDIKVVAAETTNFTTARVYARQSEDFGDLEVQVYQSTDGYIDGNDVPLWSSPRVVTPWQCSPARIDADYCFDVPLPVIANPNAGRYLMIKVDPENKIHEYYEWNNSAYAVPIFAAGEQMNREWAKQVTGISETAASASGPGGQAICEYSPAFNALNDLTTVWPRNFFLSAENPSHRRVQSTLMTPTFWLEDLIERDLNQIPEYWKGLDFSVNDAWALTGHSANSLHKNARGIDFDVTPYTNPNADPSLGRLAGLAWLAGFDWVENETHKPHVHVSQRADTNLTQSRDCTQFIMNSPANMLVTDSSGRRVGILPSGQQINEIPNAYFSGPGTHPQVITLPDTESSSLTVDVVGTDSGPYRLSAFSSEADAPLLGSEAFKSTTPGQTTRYHFERLGSEHLQLSLSAFDDGAGDLTVNLSGDGDVVIDAQNGLLRASVAGRPLSRYDAVPAADIVSALFNAEDHQNHIDLSKLAAADFSALTEAFVVSDADDTVDLGTGWNLSNTQVVDGRFYRVLTRGSTSLFLAGPQNWQNPIDAFDVVADGNVVPQDVLVIINELNQPSVSNSGRQLPDPASLDDPFKFFYDVNGDGFATPIDALHVINFLNNDANGEGEGPRVARLLATQAWTHADPPTQSVQDVSAGDDLLAVPATESRENDTIRVGEGELEPYGVSADSSAQADDSPEADLLDETLLSQLAVDQLPL